MLTRRGSRNRNAILAGIRRGLGAAGMGSSVNQGYSIAFQALTISPSDNSIQGVTAGTGSLTTTHADTLYGKQADGVYYPFAANEAVYSGGRVVENTTTYSQDGSNIAWLEVANGIGTSTKTADYALAPDGTMTAIRAELDITGWSDSNDYAQFSNNTNPNYSSDWIQSMWIKSNTGENEKISIVRGDGFTTQGVIITPEWQRFTFAFTGTNNYGLRVRLRGTQDTDDTADLLVWGAQSEDAANRADKTTPSEYIPTTTAAVTKVFNTAGWEKGSPNAVVDNVVTENARKVTNLATYSDDQNTNWSMSGNATTSTETTDRPDGSTGTVNRIQPTDTSTNQWQMSGGSIATGGKVTISAWLRITGISGSNNIRLKLHSTSSATLNVTSEWQRFSHTETLSAGGMFPNIQYTESDTISEYLEVYGVQVEYTEDRIDQTTPSEYVATNAYQADEDVLPSNYLSADPWTDNTTAGEFNATGSSLEFNFDVGYANIEMDILENGEDYVVQVDIIHLSGQGARIDLGGVQVIGNTGTTTGTVIAYGTASGTALKISNGTSAAAEFTITGLRVSKQSTGTEAKTGGNPNTVASNVVTEGTAPEYPHNVDTYGSPFDGLWLQHLPAATNSATYSNDATNWVVSGTPVTAFDQVGLDGSANSASTIEDNDAGAWEYVQQTSISITGNSTSTSILWLKKDATYTTSVPLIVHTFSGTASKQAGVWIDVSNGSSLAYGADSANATFEVIDDGDWWKVLHEHTDTGSNNVASLALYPAGGETIGTPTASGVGTVTLGNFHYHKGTTIPEVRGLSPIFTTTTAVSVAKTNYLFDLANHSDSAQMVVLELYSEVSGTEYAAINTSPSRLWSTSTSQSVMMYFGTGSGVIFNRDGTETTVTTGDYGDANTVHKAGAVWDDTASLKTVGVDSDIATPEAYDGSYNLTGSIQPLSDNPCPMKMRNIKLYSIDSWAKGYAALQNFLS